MQDDNVSDQFMGMGLNAGTQSSKKNVRGVLKIYDFSMWKKMRGNQRFMSSPFDGSKNMLVPYFTGQHLTLVHFGLFKFFRQINL